MKNRIGKPEFLVRLNESEETILIALAKDFQKDSYAKTIVAVAMNYESDKRRLKDINVQLQAENKKLQEAVKTTEKENKALIGKYAKFVSLVDKIFDIKKELASFRISGNRSQK